MLTLPNRLSRRQRTTGEQLTVLNALDGSGPPGQRRDERGLPKRDRLPIVPTSVDALRSGRRKGATTLCIPHMKGRMDKLKAAGNNSRVISSRVMASPFSRPVCL
jgi:hypothetical protein